MRRRQFLRAAALVGAALAGCASPPPRSAPSRKIVVIGAGISGLAAGDELKRAGFDVTILEARRRSGGRVLTLRSAFSDDLHAEAGALFVLGSHERTLRCVSRFNLELEPAMPLLHARLAYVRRRHIVENWTDVSNWPFAVTAAEQRLGLQGMWKQYIEDAIPQSVVAEVAAQFDRMSVLQFLRARGASDEAIALLRVGFLDMMGDGIESYSALHMLHRVALAKQANNAGPFTIRDGSDVLAHRFAESLADRIVYNAPVVRIERKAGSIGVIVERDGVQAQYLADRVVCTIPFSVLKTIEIIPAFSADKRAAIAELSYTSVARVFLQFRRRRWTAENLYVLATSDLPMKWAFEHTVNQAGPRGILEAQFFGTDARRVARMPEAGRIDFALDQLGEVFPGLRGDYERGASKCWDDDPWTRGAFVYFAPGQVLRLGPHLATPEEGVHFAGDHTSLWSGWLEGALESGVRAAREVIDAMNAG